MPRFWLSGPRILSGLIRPGISFSLSELKGKPSRTRGGEPAGSADDQEKSPPSTGIGGWLILALAAYGVWSLLLAVFSSGRYELYFCGFSIVVVIGIMVHAIRRQRVIVGLISALLLAMGLLIFLALAVAPAHAASAEEGLLSQPVNKSRCAEAVKAVVKETGAKASKLVELNYNSLRIDLNSGDEIVSSFVFCQGGLVPKFSSSWKGRGRTPESWYDFVARGGAALTGLSEESILEGMIDCLKFALRGSGEEGSSNLYGLDIECHQSFGGQITITISDEN